MVLLKDKLPGNRTVFKLLEVSGLDELWLDGLKPPEEFSDEDHHIMLHRETKKRLNQQ